MSRITRAACLVLCAFIVSENHSLALDPFKRLSQMGHRTFTREQGLPQDSVRAIAQAADGTLWLGTDEGLAAFDGTEFVIFRRGDAGLPSSSITALAASRDGSMWVGTLAGVSHYRSGRFENLDEHSGLGTETVSSLVEGPDGTVWAAGGLVVSAIRDGKATNFGAAQGVPAGGLRELVSTPDGIWGAGIGTVVRLVGGQFQQASADPRLAGNITLAITEGRDRDVWLAGTKGVAHVQLDGHTDVFGAREGLPEDIARAVKVDRDGNVWVGSNTGIARLEGRTFVQGKAPGVAPTIWDLFEDSDGGFWVGTNAGLHQFTAQPFTVYGTAEGFPSDQPSVVYQEPDGTMWVGFRDTGLARLAHGSLARVTQRDGLAADEVFAVRRGESGSLLVGTRLGLTIIRGGRFTTVAPEEPLGRPSVYDVAADGPNRIWMATHNGVLRLEGGRQTTVVPGGAVLGAAAIALARQSDGTLWAGTYGQGIWRIRPGETTHFGEADGLSSDAVRALVADDDGTVWIGTAGGGLAWYRNGLFGRFTTRDGLESDNVGQIIDDGAGHLWLGTTVGLVSVDKRDLLNPAGHTPTHLFLGSEGLRSSHAAPGFPVAAGGIRDRDGRIWAITANGLASFKPADVPVIDRARQTRATAVVVEGQLVDLTREILLPPGTGRVEFHYGAVSLVSPERLRYRYRLEGFEPDWIDAGTRRVAEYSHLPAGRYRFVVAASRAGGAVDEPAAVALVQSAHWYELAWFPYVAAAIVVGLGVGAYGLRVRRVHARYRLVLEERARLSRELHDTVAQDFVGISSQLTAVGMAIRDDPTTAEQRLEIARRMAQHGLTEARRSIMDLRSSALAGRNLTEAIASAVHELAAGSGIDVEIGAEIPPCADGRVEQQLLRIVQEAVGNAIKHAEPRHIRINAEMHDGILTVTVVDDGRGFDVEQMRASSVGHFGLVGMQERAQRVGGIVRVESRVGEGTRLVVEVPFV